MTEPCENCGVQVMRAAVPAIEGFTSRARSVDTELGTMTITFGKPGEMRFHETIDVGRFTTVNGGTAPGIAIGREHTPQRCREMRQTPSSQVDPPRGTTE